MAPRTPITTQVIDRLALVHQLVHSLALRNDGVIDAEEQAALDEITEAQGAATWWDQSRREAIYLLDHGLVRHEPATEHHRETRAQIHALYPHTDEPRDAA